MGLRIAQDVARMLRKELRDRHRVHRHIVDQERILGSLSLPHHNGVQTLELLDLAFVIKLMETTTLMDHPQYQEHERDPEDHRKLYKGI
jgi:hypothetical protein